MRIFEVLKFGGRGLVVMEMQHTPKENARKMYTLAFALLVHN